VTKKPATPKKYGQIQRASKGLQKHRRLWVSPKTVELLLVTCLFLFSLALNTSRAVRADYSHDEDQFITSARLLLDEGLLPYRDYPYFHAPYLVFIYALLFAVAGDFNLLAARLFSAFCATASVMLVFWIVLTFFRNHSKKHRFLVAFAIAFLYLPNPLLAATAGIAWNHNLSVLLMLAGLFLALQGLPRKSIGIGYFASGVLLGIAVGVRISSFTIFPAYILALMGLPGKFSWRRFIRLGLLFAAGFCLAMLPLAWFLITSPQQFIFGNFTYAQLNATYRLDIPVAYDGNIPIYGSRSLGDKLAFLWNDVILQPVSLLLGICLIFFGWSILGTHLSPKEAHLSRNILVLSALPLVAVGSFLPTPTWYQYFYAPVPFALPAVALGLSYFTQRPGQLRKWITVLLVQLVLLSNIFVLQDFRRISFLRYVDLWKPLVIHQVGVDIRDLLGAGSRVFTIAPIYPLEAGLQVYAPMATGVFAFRTGSLLDAGERQIQHIISKENLDAYLDADPPDGILVGFDQLLEQPITQYAISRGYSSLALDTRLTLWSRPGLSSK
jgi:4-amino-4-deoxy-L-arabinose transferase-like glycosyltransferase